ncbi:MAG TPA: signal peptide peptidase SppA [Streptosporangiaceae bacterium]|nr:signal peptide peptidase SppA [Streptosporangiaceae bacterium]
MAPTGIPDSIMKLAKQRTAPLILELDLTEGLLESRPPDPLSAIMSRHQPTITDILSGLRMARDDQRVKALVVKVGGRAIGLGVVQELRQAIKRFGESGKPTFARAETFGEFAAGNLPYYLATAFDTIFLQPSGDVGLTGLAVERVFLRGALDKLGVTMEVGARHEFKSAAEQLTERGFSEPAREATKRMAESVTDQLTEAITERKNLGRDDATRLINGGPYVAGQALEAGLVDALGYRDEVYAAVRAKVKATEETGLLYLARYQRYKEMTNRVKQLSQHGLQSRGQPAVALVHATGLIRRGRSGRGSPLSRGEAAMGSDSITATLRAATRDPHIKAIVLRVNSPGGSYVASDSIWREVVRTRNAGKPVVVSMGDVAASGGYFISMAADAIIAQPGTITGSIGVITAKPVLSEAYGKAGLSTDSVVLGKHAGMFSTAHPFTSEEWQLVDIWLDRIYADFTGKVAAGRTMSAERVHELARGRVWTGADARDSGLVDELGGIEEATVIARRRAGLPATAPLVHYPRLGPLDRIRPASNSEDRRAAAEVSLATGDGLAGALAGPLLTTALTTGLLRADQALAATALGASMLAESWGPVWQAAAACGLPAAGPLLLPGSWTFH